MISVQAISKAYRIWDSPAARLMTPCLAAAASMLPQGAPGKRALLKSAGRHYRDFWALKDISLEVNQGECVGIIGRNGSGKSTLLQLMAGTLLPTSGTITINGRVAALLELGSGFNPEFTGRENVYLNGAVLGLSRREIDGKFDQIAAFADIGDFIDQPVKTYSSGMFVRLAFAVQTSVEPQILIVDEALSVGDVFFQQRCYKRMQQLLDLGVCVVLASHDLGAVQQFCKHTLVLHRGQRAFYGPSTEATMQYFQLEQAEKTTAFATRQDTLPTVVPATPPAPSREALTFWPAHDASLPIDPTRAIGNGWARCSYLAVCNDANQTCLHFHQGETLRVYYEFEALSDMEFCIGCVTIRDKSAQPVHSRITLQDGLREPALVKKGSRLRFVQDTILLLHCADYTLDISLDMIPARLLSQPGVTYSDYMTAQLRICEVPAAAAMAVRLRNDTKPFQLLHFGLAGLPGSSKMTLIPPSEI